MSHGKNVLLQGLVTEAVSFSLIAQNSKCNLSIAIHVTAFLLMFECTNAMYQGAVLGDGAPMVRGRACCEQNTHLRWERAAGAPGVILLTNHSKPLAVTLFPPAPGKGKIRKRKSCYK